MINDDYINNNTNNFCVSPWTQVYLDPQGLIFPCCMSSEELGNLKDSSMEQILSGDKFIAIKKRMINDEKSPECFRCFPSNNSHKDFNFNESFKASLKLDLSKKSSEFYNNLNNFQMNYLDLRFINTCNYACVYCGPRLSSLWSGYQKLEFFSKWKNTSSPNFDQKDINDRLYNYVEKHISELEVVHMAGGEPLLIKENLRFVNLFKLNKKIELRITTNLSEIDNEIFNILVEHPNCQWRISVDDIGTSYDYIRYPGNWNNFFNNLKILKSKVGVEKISFSMVYLALNSKSIFYLIDVLRDEGWNDNNFDVTYVDLGNYKTYNLDPRFLPNQYLQEVKEIILSKLEKNPNIKFQKQFKNIYDILNIDIDHKEHYQNFLFTSLNEFDKIRKTNSKEIYPDIYKFANN